MQDVNRIRYVTAHYESLQGLALLPWAAYGVAFGTARLVTDDAAFDWQSLAWSVALLPVLAAEVAIRRAYRRRYGHVKRLADHRTGLGVLFLAAWFVLMWVNHRLALPFDLTPLAFSAFPLIAYVRGREYRRHYAAVAAFVALLALWLLANLPRVSRDGILWVGAGVALLAAGLGDHVLLTRTMSPVPEDGDGQPV